MHLLRVLHDRDLVVVRLRERGRVGHCERDVLPEVVRRTRTETRQRVDELPDSVRSHVARSRLLHGDRRDHPVVERCRRRCAGAGRIGDRHIRHPRVSGAGRVDEHAVDRHRRRRGCENAVRVERDRIELRPVEDGDARRGRVARAWLVHDDPVRLDRPVHHPVERVAQRRRRDMPSGLHAVGAVRKVEVHGRGGVAAPPVGHGDCIDAAVGGRRGTAPRTGGRDRDYGLGVAASGRGDGDVDDSSLLDDGRVSRRAGSGAGDGDLGGRVAFPPSVTLMAVIDPPAPTVASAFAPVPVPVIVIVAAGSVSGLFAQFG